MARARVAGALLAFLGTAVPAAPVTAQTVRIIQTNAAGDNVHVIDPVTNAVVEVIEGIPMPHGVTSHPDGSRLYISNEVDRTVDVVSTRTFRVTKQIPLTGRPHNIAISRDGTKLYVALIAGRGADVIDTGSEQVARTVRIRGGLHNIYVTPDGKHAVAGSIGGRHLTVVDTETDEVAWSVEFAAERGGSALEDGGVRPMAFETGADGSTRRIFVQVSGLHGFAVVDWDRREEVGRVEVPKLPVSQVDNDALQGSPGHGLVVAPAGNALWFASKPHNAVYGWSLPDLEFLGGVTVGYHPDWLTMEPNGRYVYAANAGSNDVSVVDTEALREVARIPVGQTPKRNHTLVLPH